MTSTAPILQICRGTDYDVYADKDIRLVDLQDWSLQSCKGKNMRAEQLMTANWWSTEPPYKMTLLIRQECCRNLRMPVDHPLSSNLWRIPTVRIDDEPRRNCT